MFVSTLENVDIFQPSIPSLSTPCKNVWNCLPYTVGVTLLLFFLSFFAFLSCPEPQTCFISPWGQTDAARALTNSPPNKLPAKKL